MSFDRFASGLQLPNVGSGVSPRASDSSDFLRLYFKTDQLYHTDEAGTEVQLTGLGLAFDDLTDKASGTGTYATTGWFTSGLGSGGVSITNNDGGGNANVTFNHRSMTPEQTGNAGRIHVNTDLTSGASMQFQVGSGLTAGVSAGITTYFTIEENLLTANAAFKLLDSKELRFGTGTDWAFQFNGTDAYMDLDSGTWRWRDGANSNAVRIQWTPSAGLEFQDGHQLQLGTSNDLRMYHASNINYFDLVNGDLKIRDVSGTATDRFVFTQDGELGIGTDSPDVALSVATNDNTDTGPDKAIRLGHTGDSARSAVLTKSRDYAGDKAELQLKVSRGISGSPLTFYSNVNDETMRLDENGNLGIGEDAPASKLHITETTTSTYLATFQGDLGTNNGRVLRLKTPGTDSISEPFTWQTGNSIAWQVDASEAMRLDSVGNLGIGTPSPSTALEVSGTITSDEIHARVTSSGTTTGTLTASDANTKVTMTGDITVPNSTFATDDTIMFDGNGADRTLTPAVGLTIYVDGAAASSIDVGANKIVGLTFRSGTVAIATGVDATTSTTYLYSATSTDTTTNHNASFTPTVVDFDTELINQGSFTESGGRITVPIAGVYRVYGMVTYGRNSTEQRLSLQLQVHKNGTATGARGRGAYVRGQNNHDHASAYIEDFVDCAANDILDVRAFQDAISGTSIVQSNQSRLLIQRIG